MAYDAFKFSARLSLHSPGRKSAWRGEALCKLVCDDAAWRAVARSELDVCDLGSCARHLLVDQPSVAAAGDRFAPRYRLATYISSGSRGMGIVSRPFVSPGSGNTREHGGAARHIHAKRLSLVGRPQAETPGAGVGGPSAGAESPDHNAMAMGERLFVRECFCTAGGHQHSLHG